MSTSITYSLQHVKPNSAVADDLSSCSIMSRNRGQKARAASLSQSTCAAPTRRQTSAKRIWFDLLPQGVLARMAAFVCSGSKAVLNDDIVTFASCSESLREAALAAVSFKLSVSEINNLRDVAKWEPLFMNRVQHIDFQHYLPSTFGSTMLFTSSSLRYVRLAPDENFLSVIAQMPPLQEIHLKSSLDVPRETVIQVLNRIKVSKLFWRCSVPSRCPFAEWTGSRCRGLTFAECRDLLMSLEIYCFCQTQDPLQTALTSNTFPSVKEITLTASNQKYGVSPSALPVIQRMEAVRIRSRRDSLDLATQVGSPVSELDTFASAGPAQLQLLDACPRLSKLEICLERGAESSLVNVADTHPYLESVWFFAGAQEQLRRQHFSSVERPQNKGEVMIPGKLFHFVAHTKALKRISFGNLHIGVDEVLEILRSLNSDLESLGIRVDHPQEGQVHRIESIFNGLFLYNSNLKELHTESGHSPGDSRGRLADLWDVSQVKKIWHLLRRRFPLLKCVTVKRYLRKICSIDSATYNWEDGAKLD